MDVLNIAVLETNENIKQKFSRIEGADKEIFWVDDPEALNETISTNNIHIILFSFELYEASPPLRQLVRKKEYLIAVYANKDDPAERSNLITKGVWFFWNISHGVSEFADRILLVTNRQKMIKKRFKQAETSGNLADIPLGEVITHITFNNLTTRLTIYSNFGYAVLFFDQGTLTHARQGKLRGNAAVLNAFIWPGGTYFVDDFPLPESPPNITASFVALIAEGTYRKEQFWNFWSTKLNFNSPVIIRDSNPRSLTPRINRLLPLINRQDSLIQIILFSETDIWQLVHDFDRMIAKKAIEYIPDSENIISRDGFSASERSFFTKTESIALEKVLFAGHKNVQEGKFIVAGASGSGLIEFIRTVSGKMSAPVKQIQNLIFSRILLNEKYISFFGVTIEEKFTQFIDKLSENMLGFILLIDARNKADLEFTSYVMNSLFASYPEAIFTVALTHSEKARALPMEVIKQTVQLPGFLNLSICNIDDPASIKELVFSLRENPGKK